jgi:hypothetical protein
MSKPKNIDANPLGPNHAAVIHLTEKLRGNEGTENEEPQQLQQFRHKLAKLAKLIAQLATDRCHSYAGGKRGEKLISHARAQSEPRCSRQAAVLSGFHSWRGTNSTTTGCPTCSALTACGANDSAETPSEVCTSTCPVCGSTRLMVPSTMRISCAAARGAC